MGNSINQQLQIKSITTTPPPEKPLCTYRVGITSKTPKSTSCLDGNDDATGIATFTRSLYAKEENCQGKREIQIDPIEVLYKCPLRYSNYSEPIDKVNDLVQTRICGDGKITSITGTGRLSGNTSVDAINIGTGINADIPCANVSYDDVSLLDKLTINDNIVSTEGFENQENELLIAKTFLQNKFNDFYHTYIYKCQGDEKQYNAAKEQLLQITKGNDYNRMKKLGQQLYTSQLVLNDGENVVDCNSLKQYVDELSKYNLPGGITTVTNKEYTDKRNLIRDKYIKLNNERDKLDEKLRDLYNIPGYSSAESKLEYDSTIYAGVVITIIASSLVYYAFTKI